MKIIRFIINKPIFQYKISIYGLLSRMTVFFFPSVFSILPFSLPEALETQDGWNLMQVAELE